MIGLLLETNQVHSSVLKTSLNVFVLYDNIIK